ncbi:sulfatase [Pedobacter sp. SD-b]|uniref:Sulfatase n=1 Tax=Pedobacter segetis TaxID=2793069 RepID=A0ABS1BLD7_9SPHI|nr:sulfatase [Pedobacter segetis]MBK0383699.1 sulfatase [Pedobacter segetis]
MRIYFTTIIILMSLTSIAQHLPKKPNVLFIVIDDLRPELICYNKNQIKSPNIDNLAQNGLTFSNSYCNVPVCGASRASFLTGVRPARNRFLVADTRADIDLPGNLSLPMYLKQNGYTTLSLGKVFHNPDDDLSSWSEKPLIIEGASHTNYVNKADILFAKKAEEDGNNGKRGPAFELGEETNPTMYPDGKIAQMAVGKLDSLKNANKPFFLAVGFHKPHLPFVAPKKYFDLYKLEDLKVASNQFVPKNAPSQAISASGELRTHYTGVPTDRILPDDYAISLRQAYYASISFVDEMVGQVLDKLKTTGINENTIVVLIGDHGYNLGEHAMWGKHNTFETALRAPLIISAPGLSEGKKTVSLAEFVDIYPTITELCGFKIPSHCQGQSLVPILKNPETKVKDEIYALWRGAECVHTIDFAYTEWRDPKKNHITESMLYDLKKDPNENVSVAKDLKYKPVIQRLSKKIEENVKRRN